MNRRKFLAVTATPLSLAGCAGGPSSDSSTAVDTPTPSAQPTTTPTATSSPTPNQTRRASMGETVTIDGESAIVKNPHVSKSILALGVHGATLESFSGQFVVADVSGSVQPAKDIGGIFRPSIDEKIVDITGPRGGTEPLPIADTERAYAVPFPVQSVETAAIAWSYNEQTVYWELPANIRDSLAREPVFSVEEFRLPRRDGQLVLHVTVANKGDRDGLFRMQVSTEAFSGHEIIQFPIPAGESRDYTGQANGLVLL